MPGILPPPPSAPNFSGSPSLLNASKTQERDIAREIKDNAQELVRKESQGASMTALLSQVKIQYQYGKDHDRTGNLKEALSAFSKAAALVKLIIEKSNARNSKDVKRVVDEFMTTHGEELSKRSQGVERRLREIQREEERERERKQPNGVEHVASSSPKALSIADRMAALRSNGLSISTNKRPPTTGQSPSSPIPPSPPFARPSQPIPIAPSPLTSAPSISSLTSAFYAPSTSIPSGSPHSFVPPSAFGPPSRSPSPPPSTSPQADKYLSDFNHNFPSIDEIEESADFGSLADAPTGRSTGSASSRISSSPISSMPHAALRFMQVPLERPSSTPIPPLANNFNSRPASPSSVQPKPSIPIKPSNLSASTSASAVANGSNGYMFPISQSPSYSNGILSAKTNIPMKGTATPKELKEYMKDHRVLLLDVRERAEFDQEHIRTNGTAAIVRIDPSLVKEGATGDVLESATSSSDVVMFKNRHHCDLVVMYDQNSSDTGDQTSLLNILKGVIFTNELKKFLKRPPMVLEGGLDAWKAEMGQQEVEGSNERDLTFVSSGSASASASASASTNSGVNVSSVLQSPPPLSSSPLIAPPLSRTTSHNPFATGGALSYTRPRGTSISNGSVLQGNSAHQLWQPSAASTSPIFSSPGRSRADTNPSGLTFTRSVQGEHKSNYSLDQKSMHSRYPADSGYTDSSNGLQRRPAFSRGPPSLSTTSFTMQAINGKVSQPSSPQPNGISSITYPSFSARSSHSSSPSLSSFTPNHADIASPPQASLNPPLSRRRSDYVDQSQEAVSGLHRTPIEYPELPSQHTIRPPPAVASPAFEKQENRPWLSQTYTSSPAVKELLKEPRISSEWPVKYWGDVSIGMSGLKNLGNTCYMNAPIQCLSASPPFARFFTEGRWKTAVNHVNPMGSKGYLTGAFAQLVHSMWGNELPYQTPTPFRKTICSLNSQYMGSDQHDSQEFLSFLLDGVHEDLNRIISRPAWKRTPEEEEELERLPPQIASEQEWRAWKARNDSIIVDYFQGQFRNQMKCLTCQKTSTTYNTFSILSLPIPHGRSGKVPLQRCLDNFFETEVMEKDDAWDCPRCKTKQRASKQLSLARLPPILVIHLKRFEANGRFSDKIDNFVDFPIKSLDLTSYMPPSLPVGLDRGQMQDSPDDPRTQLPPYKYDLYGVTNHVGNLSSGHYTAFVGSRGGWMYCDDSVIKPVDSKQVVSQKAYVLFYKRIKA